MSFSTKWMALDLYRTFLNAQLGNFKAQLFRERCGRELADCFEQSIWQFSDWIGAVIWLYGTHYQL